MRLIDNLKVRFKALTATSSAIEAFRTMGAAFFNSPNWRAAYIDGVFREYQDATYGYIYRSQENVRIVVDAIARHASKRSLKCYNKTVGGKPSEDYTFEAYETLCEPNDFQSQKQLLNMFVTDKLIFEDAYLWDMGPVEDGKRFLIRVPPPAMGVSTDNSLKPIGYTVRFQNGSELPLKPWEVIHWAGYNPDTNRVGVSKLETLRVMLTENAVRKAHLIDMIKGGLIKGGIVSRGLDAPEWSPKARRRFEENFASRLRGASKGEIAMLEDSMTFSEAGITPQQAELLESKKFDLALTANIYGVNPGFFSNEGNLAQAREQMEEDVIEALVNDLADILTLQLIREIYNDYTHYFKFTRAQITDLSTLFEAGSKATGGSVLTANEFRADYMDKPPIDGGDSLVVHPGAQEGGLPPKPGAEDRGTPAPPAADLGADATVKEFSALVGKALQAKDAERLQTKADLEAVKHLQEKMELEHVALLSRHFSRQRAAHEGGQVPALNSARWDRELSSDLRELAAQVVMERGEMVAKTLAFEFRMEEVDNYLTAGADIVAKKINDATVAAVHSDIAEGKTIAAAYESRIKRAKNLASSRVTQLMSFATLEAARQSDE